MPDHERSRLSRWLLPHGTEPDPRFTLANERTFLAWIRTSLAFLAGGTALEAFAAEAFPSPLRTWLAVLIIGVGILIAAGAAVRWVRVERSMRTGRPLPIPAIVPLLGFGAVVASLAAVAMIVGSRV
ncbi:YidH family protein [Glutamicibacter arilaitensis]|uniref:YidH family protein n=1 Tax=Glutamicibacter arilaitensis TaxID=256701 RepID=UPI00384CF686